MPGQSPRLLSNGARRAGASARRRSRSLARRGSLPERAAGGLGGTSLVVGVRWSFRGKDAGSVNSGKLLARLRAPPRGEHARPDGTGYVSPRPPTRGSPERRSHLGVHVAAGAEGSDAVATLALGP